MISGLEIILCSAVSANLDLGKKVLEKERGEEHARETPFKSFLLKLKMFSLRDNNLSGH